MLCHYISFLHHKYDNPIIPLFIDPSQSDCFIKTEEFPHGRIMWTHGNKSLFLRHVCLL